jgi:hypothetical protein
MRQSMRHSSSVPHNLHSALHSLAGTAGRGEACGFVLLRATRVVQKAMHVQFLTAAIALVIRLVQDADDQCHTFDLCRLDYCSLAVCWIWDYPTAFVLSASNKHTHISLPVLHGSTVPASQHTASCHHRHDFANTWKCVCA